MFRILHLSDIHIGNTYVDSPVLAYRIASSIHSKKLDGIKCVVVTGDIFDGHKTDGFSINQPYSFKYLIEAVDFFSSLRNLLNQNQNEKLSVDDFLFVPGNHDILRKNENKFDLFVAFVKAFHSMELGHYKLPSYYIKTVKSSYGIEEPFFLRKYENGNPKVAFIGLNSTRYLLNQENKNILETLKLALSNLKRTNEQLDDKKILDSLQSVLEIDKDFGCIYSPYFSKINEDMEEYTAIALFHHHFSAFPEQIERFKGSGIIENYSEVLRSIQSKNVSIVMHGHKHFALERPVVLEEPVFSSDNQLNLKVIDVFSGGSVGVKGINEHTFSILDLWDEIDRNESENDDIKYVHHKFIFRGEHFDPVSKLTIYCSDIAHRKLSFE